MGKVLKIAKESKNIPDIVDNRNYIFSSTLDYLKEEQSGLIDTDVDGNVTITHNLGYVPAFLAFVADFSDLTIWYSWDMLTVYCTSTQLVITTAMGGIKSKIYYSLYSNQL